MSHGKYDVLTGRQFRASTAPMLTNIFAALKLSTRFGCYMLRRTGRSEVFFVGRALGIPSWDYQGTSRVDPHACV